MTTIQFYTQPNASPGHRVNPGSTWAIDDEINSGAQSVFRRVLFAAIPKVAQANAIKINAIDLTGEFSTRVYDVYSTSSFFGNHWQEQEGFAKISFDQPWHIHSVQATQHSTIDLHRVDGEAIADEPTQTLVGGNVIAPEFISQHFAVRQANQLHQVTAVQANKSNEFTDNKSLALNPGVGFGATDFPVTQKITPVANILKVAVASHPTTPSLLTLENYITPVDSVPLATQWLAPGQFSDPLVTDLTAAVEQWLPGAFTQAVTAGDENLYQDDSYYYLPLIIQSDQPCYWQANNLVLDINYLVTQFNGQQPKVTLEFSGHNPQSLALPLALPTGHLIKGTLKITTGNRGDQILSRPATSDFPANKQSDLGVFIQTNGWASTACTVDQAGFYSGLLLELSVLSEVAEVEVQLLASQDAESLPLKTITRVLTRRDLVQSELFGFQAKRFDTGVTSVKLLVKSGQLIWRACTGDLAKTNTTSKLRADANTGPITVDFSLTLQLLAANTANPDAPIYQLTIGDTTPQWQLSEGGVTISEMEHYSSEDTIAIAQAARGLLVVSNPYFEFSV